MYITLEEVTAEAMSVIPNATTTDMLMARQWAYRALQQIGPYTKAVKNDEIKVKTFTIEKPCDHQSTIDIALYDENDKEVNYIYNGLGKAVHVKKNERDSVNTIKEEPIYMSEDDHFYHLSTDATNVKYAKIRYFSIPIDDKGKLLIPEIYTLAIIYFIRFMHSLRRNDNQSEIDTNERRWFVERKAARGRAKMPSMFEAEHIMKSWMSMIAVYKHDKF